MLSIGDTCHPEITMVAVDGTAEEAAPEMLLGLVLAL